MIEQSAEGTVLLLVTRGPKNFVEKWSALPLSWLVLLGHFSARIYRSIDGSIIWL